MKWPKEINRQNFGICLLVQGQKKKQRRLLNALKIGLTYIASVVLLKPTAETNQRKKVGLRSIRPDFLAILITEEREPRFFYFV